MVSSEAAARTGDSLISLVERYQHVRAATLSLCEHLAPEDHVVQSMPDVSPTKWHLAHVTWFFERFVLKEYSKTYDWFNEDFDFVLNSYFYTVGGMVPSCASSRTPAGTMPTRNSRVLISFGTPIFMSLSPKLSLGHFSRIPPHTRNSLAD